MQSKQTVQVGILSLVAMGLLIAIFYAPTWWVSLTAPNYPAESFPDGVRIHFHMNGVFNGCTKQDKAEIQEDEALDCVHEMDTINHYVGMYPIAAGGPVERAFSQFLLVMLGVMLVGFMCTKPKVRMGIMSLGFAGIIGWMYLTMYTDGGFSMENGGYVEALVTSLDQDAGGDRSDEPEFVIGGIVGVLKDSLAESGVSVVLPSEMDKNNKGGTAGKAELIEQLRITYDRDQQKQEAPVAWDGSTFQVMTWHYGKSLGRYFNNQEEIVPMVATLKIAVNVAFFGLIAAMVLLVFGARKNSGLLYWLLVLVPMALPLFFIIDYSAWLWWYGHTLNDMGAFTVKQFMPTVFGQGKVAQFATHSYPSTGFGLMMVTSVVLAVAALIRKKQFSDRG
ncbi:MAG: hypothetical protein ABW148_18480 [Sedimenticola sp.]